MNVIEAIHCRHSYRGKYKDIPVPRKDLITIMEAGLSAPSGCNKQTTSLIAVDDREVLSRIRQVIDPPVGETATAAIFVLTRRLIAYRDKCFSTQDYAAAIENMLLAAIALGYQSCWYEGHITDEDRIGDQIAKILNIPSEYELVCFLPIGLAEEEPKLPQKKAFYERAWFNQFPNADESLTKISLLQSTRNTRDLGGYRTADGKCTCFHRIYRSDKLGTLSENDAQYLISHAITTIIDMRENDAVLKTPDVLPFQESFHYCHYPVEEGAAVPETAEAVPGTYFRIACAGNIRQIFQAIADAEGGVLLHCSAGKDRTGVVSAILLLLCGVSENDIVEEYMLTRKCLWESFEKLSRETPVYDLNVVIPKEFYMREFLKLFTAKFGTAREYFRSLGLRDATIEQLRRKLTD